MSLRWRFEAIGTAWEIDTPVPLPDRLTADIIARTEAFDALYSRFRADSRVRRIAESPRRFAFRAEDAPLFDLYGRLYALTDGAVDPLVGRDLERLGYDRSYSLRPRPRTSGEERPRWTRDVRRDGATLDTVRPVILDIGAAGKGWLVDRLAALLAQEGYGSYLIDAGGDMRHAVAAPVRVGLEHPAEAGTVIGIVELRGRALCASAVNRRAWGDGVHHVLDARTGEPTRDVVATWTLAESTALADGLATAPFFTSGTQLAEALDFQFVRMFGAVEHSIDFPGTIFFAERNTAPGARALLREAS